MEEPDRVWGWDGPLAGKRSSTLKGTEVISIETELEMRTPIKTMFNISDYDLWETIKFRCFLS